MDAFFLIDANQNVTPVPEALILKPFKAIWDRDKTKSKINAVSDLAFVYHFSDYKSSFQNILDEDHRTEQIAKVLPDFKGPDELIWEACNFYKERQHTVSMDLLETAKIGIKKLKEYIRDVDLDEKDKNQKKINDPKKLKDILDGMSSTVESLQKVEEMVKREIQADAGMKGAKEKTMFEDGI